MVSIITGLIKYCFYCAVLMGGVAGFVLYKTNPPKHTILKYANLPSTLDCINDKIIDNTMNYKNFLFWSTVKIGNSTYIGILNDWHKSLE